jgi:nucleoside-diphosphate-sugar epimerase
VRKAIPLNTLVTGASGFIGRVLVETLLTRGHHVRALVRRCSQVAPLTRPEVELVYGDLRDADGLKEAVRGVDVVFHAAARVEVWGAWREFHDVNVQGTRHVIEALLAARVPRLVHFSSTSVYGRQTGIIDENSSWQRTGDFYSDSKIAAEEIVLEASHQHQISFTILRPSLVYGPYDYKYVPRVTANIVKGRMPIVGRGDSTAAVVYGEDVAELALLAAESDSASGQVFNVSGGELVSWKEFFTTLAALVGKRLPRVHLPVPIAYAAAAVLETVWKTAHAVGPPPATRFGVRLVSTDRQYDCSKAATVLGYRARVFHKEGLQRTLNWMQAEKLPGLPIGSAAARGDR